MLLYMCVDDLEGNEVLVKGTSFQKLIDVFSHEFRNEQLVQCNYEY